MALNLKHTWFFLAIMLLATLLLIEVIIIFATDTDAILTAQPAYAITLFIVGLGSLLTLGLLVSRSRTVFRQSTQIQKIDDGKIKNRSTQNSF